MDMMQVFQILNNIDDVKMEGLFEYLDLNTRGHSKKMSQSRALNSYRMKSFCIRTKDK